MVGLDPMQVRTQLELQAEGFLATSLTTQAAALAYAKEGAEYAKGIAPVAKAPHTLPSGYVDNPGDYRDSIEGVAMFKNGRWIGRVIARDYKAFWIEFGTKRWAKHAVLRRTREYVDGRTV
ncbi:hypothetical protein ACKAMS_24855 [Rhodococcus sp. 5A-K4]|uniref:hypothetical protein n=1 Tax=Rhodococcus sp. 5A-K4 TaxID=3384442 RepID=UPI0038D36192